MHNLTIEELIQRAETRLENYETFRHLIHHVFHEYPPGSQLLNTMKSLWEDANIIDPHPHVMAYNCGLRDVIRYIRMMIEQEKEANARNNSARARNATN